MCRTECYTAHISSSIFPTTPFYGEVKNFTIISKMVKLGETQIDLIPTDCALPEVQALDSE